MFDAPQSPDLSRFIGSSYNPQLKRHWLHPLGWLIAAAALALFACSVWRHESFHSTPFDLAIFDQSIYLLSQGQTPFSTIRNLHILGDHAALIVYPIALLYKIYPHVYWLFAVQAVGLALAAWPIWGLVRQAGLSQQWAWTVIAAYLLYPVVLALSLFDFHPEALFPFALFSAVWAARSRRLLWFIAAILLALSLKDALTLVIMGLGFWLWKFERQRRYGAIAFVCGLIWFFMASRWIIPTFSGGEPAAIIYFQYLGKSVPEIATNLVLQPGLVLSYLFRQENLIYLIQLFAPLLWGLSWRGLSPLVAATPIFVINLLSQGRLLRDLNYQYSLPILPFLILAVINTLAMRKSFLQKQARRVWLWPKLALIWSLIGFIWLANYQKVPQYFVETFREGHSTRAAIAQLPPQVKVLADRFTVPHICHRPEIRAIAAKRFDVDLAESDYFLFDLGHARGKDASFVKGLAARMQNKPNFDLIYQQGQAYLFKRVKQP